MHHILIRHTNASAEDLEGNHGIGRYILISGSDGRAKKIAQHFTQLTVKTHPRGHHLYLGTLLNGEQAIDVAVISSGMGCASMEIILHELFHLGGKRFLRVGTAGSLQASLVKVGDVVNAQASVRDEQTTIDYVPLAVPAIASTEMNLSAMESAKQLNLSEHLHTGIVHCKSSLYAREFGFGPKAEENKAYMHLLSQYGVLATEMETAALFIQSQFYNYQLMQKGTGPQYRVLCGALLGVISTTDHIASLEEENITTDRLILLALETIKMLVKHYDKKTS